MRDRAGLAIAAVLSTVYFVLGWMRHLNHWTGAFDLGFFDQAVWQLAHGRTHSSLLGRSLFSDHLSGVLVGFAPLYRLAATPAWLMGAQALALGFTVVPLRALARELGVDVRWATALVVVSPPLLAAALFDFHPSSLAVPFVAYAVLAARRDDARLAALAGLAVVLCRADLGVALLGVAVVSRPAARRPLVLVGLAGALVGAILPEVLGNPGGWDAYYSRLGSGPLDAALHPWRVVQVLASRSVVALVLGWLLAVGLLPLLRPRWVVATVVAALPILLSGFPGPTLPWFHHGAVYVPLLIGGALAGLGDVPVWTTRLRPAVRTLVPVMSVGLALLLVSPLSPKAPGSTQVYRALRAQRDAGDALALVRQGDAVSASARIVPQLSQRERVHLYPLPFEEPDTTFPAGLAPAPRLADIESIDVIVLEVDPGDDRVQVEGFEVVWDSGGLLVLRRSEGV